jgi:hypothetical protein
MKFAIILVAGSLSGTTFASAAMDELHAQMSSLGDQATACADFSGTWQGTCVTRNLLDASVAAESRAESMTFKQFDCAALQSEQFGMAQIGTVNTKSTSSERGVLTSMGATYWQDGGKILGMAEQFNLVLHGSVATLRKGKTHGEFKRDGDAIVGKIVSHIVTKDMTSKVTGTVHEESACRLELQPK